VTTIVRVRATNVATMHAKHANALRQSFDGVRILIG
jgi:hypothetical protein